ncbi:MAG: hypothetical protein V1676_05185 [Candidatus Diapherotrites archaeon]
MAKIRVNRQNSILEIPRGDFGALEFDSAREYEIMRVKKGVYVLTEGAEKTIARETQGEQGAEKIIEQKPVQQPSEQQGARVQQAQQPSAQHAAQHDAVREKIVKFLSNKKMLPQRVVGRFEKTLNAEELKRFNAMLASGEIEKFRLSPKYKNAVYQLSEKNKGAKGSAAQGAGAGSQSNTAPNSGQQGTRAQGNAAPNPQQKAQQEAGAQEKRAAQNAPHLEPTLDRDGFLVVQNESLAKQISMDRSEDIRKGEIMGLRSFEGPFYIIKGVLYRNVRKKIENALEKNKTMPLEELAKELNTEKTVIKIACEFMKEDGSLLEKRRGIYRLC